ncbi:MAG TPA: hypothetical protein VF069_06320 [Streptosporangiaceae bacterium]
MPLEIKVWEVADFTPGTKSAEGKCTWGGDPCARTPEFTVTDRAGTRWAACEKHIVGYIRDRLHG